MCNRASAKGQIRLVHPSTRAYSITWLANNGPNLSVCSGGGYLKSYANPSRSRIDLPITQSLSSSDRNDSSSVKWMTRCFYGGQRGLKLTSVSPNCAHDGYQKDTCR
jgi:hypothetical protein